MSVARRLLGTPAGATELPMFQICFLVPIHDDRDAIVGERVVRQPYAYLTKECALAVARRTMEDSWCDVLARVVPYGGNPLDWNQIVQRQPTAPAYEDDTIPF